MTSRRCARPIILMRQECVGTYGALSWCRLTVPGDQCLRDPGHAELPCLHAAASISWAVEASGCVSALQQRN